MDGDAPRGGAFVNDLLQLGIHLGPADQDVGQHALADDLAQGGLGGPGDGGFIICNLQGGFFRIPDDPEEHRIHIHRYGVFRQGFLGREGRDHYTVVDPVGEGVNEGQQPEEAWSGQFVESAQAKDDRFLPLRGDLEPKKKIGA